MTTPRVLPVEEGFRRWAPTYDETPLSRLEVKAFEAVAPPVRGRRLLDAGCGTGRRLPTGSDDGPVPGPAMAVGVDLSGAMLARARDARREPPPEGAAPRLVRGDVARLPFGSGTFDLVWCRLTLGFLPSIAGPAAEMARVLASGGEVVLTDLHPASHHAGTARSFRDADGRLLAVAHHVHPVAAILEAFARAGLSVAARSDLTVGPGVRERFGGAEGEKVYRELSGQAVVLAMRLRRE